MTVNTNKKTLLRSLPLAVSAAALLCLQYSEPRPAVTMLLAAAVICLTGLALREKDPWGFLKANLTLEAALGAAALSALFALRFFRSGLNNPKLYLLAAHLGLGPYSLCLALAVAGGAASAAFTCLALELLGASAGVLRRRDLSEGIPREETVLLKGVLVTLMVIHHAFGYPKWYVDGIAYPAIEPYAQSLKVAAKLCVGGFAFLTGYGYARRRDPSLRDSLKKLGPFLGEHLTIILLMAALAGFLGDYQVTGAALLREFLTLEMRLSTFSWYVHFHVMVMLLLPLVMGWTRRRESLLADILGLAAVWCAALGICARLPEGSFPAELLGDLAGYLPCVAVGFLLSKYRVLDGVLAWLRGRLPGWLRGLLGLGVLAAAFALRIRRPSLELWGVWIPTDFYLAPLALLGLVLMDLGRFRAVREPLRLLGSYSMEIWLLHGLFFGAGREVFQPIAYWPRNPVLVLIWILLLCLAGGWVVKRICALPRTLASRREKARP